MFIPPDAGEYAPNVYKVVWLKGCDLELWACVALQDFAPTCCGSDSIYSLQRYNETSPSGYWTVLMNSQPRRSRMPAALTVVAVISV